MHVQYNYNNKMKLRIQLYTDIIAPKFKTIANIDLSQYVEANIFRTTNSNNFQDKITKFSNMTADKMINKC